MTTDLQPNVVPGPPIVSPGLLNPHGAMPQYGPPNQSEGRQQPTVVDVLRAFWRRMWVIALIMVAAIATAVYVTHKTPPTYQAHAQMILVEHAPVIMTQTDSTAAPATQETAETQMTMLQDQEMAQRALSYLASHGFQSQINAVDLQQAIDVSNPKDTDLIDLYVKASSPRQAEMLADGICMAFITWKKQIAQHNSEEALTNLEVRANRAEASMNSAETAELKYLMAHHLVDVPGQSKTMLDQMSAADTQVAALQQQLSTDQAHLAALNKQLQSINQAIRSGTGVRDDNLVTSLQQQLSALEVQRAQAALRYTDKYPGVLPELDAQIADIKTRLTQAVQGTVDNKRPSLESQNTLNQEYQQAQVDVHVSQAKLAAAQKQQAQLKSQSAQLPERGLADNRLQRAADLDRQLYISLQSALNSARLEKDNATSNVQLVQSADVDPNPVDPNPLRNLALGAVVGIVLSIAAVMLLEQADRRVRDVDGLRALTDGPIIGALPQMNRAQIAALREGRPMLPAAEAYNIASANLALTLGWSSPFESWDHRIVLITSALPGEGKSVTAAALARSIAQTGKRVVLVSADLRRPSLDALFPSNSTVGLADVLEGDVTIEEALQPTEFYNLRILQSGNVQRNPTELISRPRMSATLRALRAVSDVVLVDTPACSVVADALLMAPHADCILHVVGAGLVDEEMVRSATVSLSAASPKTLAYVVNRASPPRSQRYGYGTYYQNKPVPVAPHGASDGQKIMLSQTMELRRADLWTPGTEVPDDARDARASEDAQDSEDTKE